jgi:hypothetical protein
MYATFNGTTWSSPVSLGVSSTAGPALTATTKTLYESWIDFSSIRVLYATFNGTSWSASKPVPGATISEETGPALEANGGVITVAWDPNNAPTGIDYSQNP